MPVEFVADQDDRLVLWVRKVDGGPVVKRESLYHVRAAAFERVTAKHGLGDRKKIRAALRLNKIRSVYNLTEQAETHPADSAIVRWIERLEQSVGRIGSAIAQDRRLFELAFEAIEGQAWDWAKKADGETLQSRGFRSRNGVELGMETREVVRRWFTNAELISRFMRDARQKLHRRNRGHGLKGLLPEGPNKESYLYGVWLPDLYEQLLGRRFGISKNPKSQKVLRTTGVDFVLDAASVIDLSTAPSNVASHYHKMRRFIKSRLAGLSADGKKIDPQPVKGRS